MVARQRQSYHTPTTSVLRCIAYLDNNEKICGPFRVTSNKLQNWPTLLVNLIMSSPTLRVINNLNCITNFIRIITADWKAFIRFPETPAWMINFINSKKVPWIRSLIESGVNSIPGLRFWMAYKNPQRAWRSRGIEKAGLACKAEKVPRDIRSAPGLIASVTELAMSSRVNGCNSFACTMIISSQPQDKHLWMTRTGSRTASSTSEVMLEIKLEGAHWAIGLVPVEIDEKDSRSVWPAENSQFWRSPRPEWQGYLEESIDRQWFVPRALPMVPGSRL